MKLKVVAEIAGIGAFLIIGLQYLKIEPNAIDELPEWTQKAANEDVAKIDLTLDEQSYISSGSIAYSMYRVAMAHSYDSNKNEALQKAVEAALKENDCKLAILAATSITYPTVMNDALSRIVEKALMDRETIGYAVLAAEYISYPIDRSQKLGMITRVYQRLADGESLNDAEFFTKSGIDTYREIFVFADASQNMGLSSKEAKEFADTWIKERSYEDFVLFKEVFIFADATQYLNKSTDEALAFSLRWLEEYNEDDFELFKEVFIFANSGANMDLDTAESIHFAFEKVHEKNKASESIQPAASIAID